MTAPRPPGGRRRGGLFGRILVTFVATALASALVAAIAGYTFAARFSSEWVAEVEEALELRSDALAAAAEDDEAMAPLVATLRTTLDARVGLYRGRAKALGDGPARLPAPGQGRRRALRRGEPVVLRHRRLDRSRVLYPLLGPGGGRPVGVLSIAPNPEVRLAIPLLSLGLVLLVLGAGAWSLSRSLTRRLGRIETSAGRIADGELGHRIALDDDQPRDELDELAQAFNEMAQRVEALLQGQRTLLANVSHELRTPIARMKVLVEILHERVATLRDRGDDSRPVLRLDKGLAELGEDIGEIETLISDLLTSGRLELRRGAAGALQTTRFDLRPLLERSAGKVGAEVDAADSLPLEADALLLERLVSNLLANARRACPDGRLELLARARDDALELVVRDEGPGVDPERRESIFEPFTRLDHARARDRGGVGLGLYLCRQICRSHGGTIEVTDRPDGRSGANFVIRLPQRRPTPD